VTRSKAHGSFRFKGRNTAGSLCVSFLFLFFLLSANSQAQIASSPAQYPATDVVVVSLEALDPRLEHRRHVTEGLVGNPDPALNKQKNLLEIQMNIVRQTAKFGPVLLLAPDESTKSAVYQRCQEFQICDLFRADRVRIKVVPHDGVWIRDFGPQIETLQDSAYVVHWRYFDIRAEEAKREKFQELETTRLKLMETRQQEDQPDDFSQESDPGAHKAVVSAIDDRLYLLREYSQILSEASLQRSNDENSAFDIADAVLATADFNFKNSAVALDGGNLLKLEDGRCLTTRTLLSRNKDQNINVDQELQKIGGCQSVTYLDPLPGPVIEHVDMFALPVGGNRILLASYDLSSSFAAEYWNKLSNSERELALNAGLAMELNAERLRRLGYEVLPVPSAFPRSPMNGHTYYPTVLNALVRTGADGNRQVLIPSYKDYETDIQSSALDQIRAAFGPKAEIVTIETTQAAKAQGAIHCLTLTAPLRLSIFGDLTGTARRTEYLARKDQLDRNMAAEVASRIPANGLLGSWVILEQEEQSDETPLNLYPQRIFFGENEFQKGVFHQLESKGTYKIDRKDLTSWSLHFYFSNQDVTPAVVQWLSKEEVRLVLGERDRILVLRRIGSDQVSPFNSVSRPEANPSEKHSTSKRPTTSLGQASGAIHLTQPQERNP